MNNIVPYNPDQVILINNDTLPLQVNQKNYVGVEPDADKLQWASFKTCATVMRYGVCSLIGGFLGCGLYLMAKPFASDKGSIYSLPIGAGVTLVALVASVSVIKASTENLTEGRCRMGLRIAGAISIGAALSYMSSIT